jgi:hypothetical protein
METNDREKLINTMAESQKCFDENGYWPTTDVPRTGGKTTQKKCGSTECYCNSPERTILRDIQRRGTEIPEEAFLKKCCWSTICGVRQKYWYKVGIYSETWRDLCARMTSIRSRNPGWLAPRLSPNPLLEALRDARRKGDTENK